MKIAHKKESYINKYNTLKINMSIHFLFGAVNTLMKIWFHHSFQQFMNWAVFSMTFQSTKNEKGQKSSQSI